MFFFLSKLFYFLVQPLNWIIFFLALTIFRKDAPQKKKYLKIGVGLLIFFSNPFIVYKFEQFWAIAPIEIASLPQNYDIGIVLGGYSNPNFEPTDRLHLNINGDRITNALELYKTGKIKKILITTGDALWIGKGLNEAEETQKFLLKLGVPNEDIILENASKNTWENAEYTARILREHYPGTSCLLITSPFHMRRSLACFYKAGVSITPFSAGDYSRTASFQFNEMFVPNANALARWDMLIKEVIGITVYKFTGKA